jgi:two-component system NtrC family sensor kinase
MSNVSTVLVVEDDIFISKLIAVLLEEANYACVMASNAAEARAQLELHSPDLVILDWMLPDMPGDQLCVLIKQSSTEAFLPVLMLTARTELADRVAGLNAGADDYMTKPFNGTELLARVRALLRIRAAEIARAEALVALHHQHDELKAAYEQLRSTQAQLIQASKLASLGELVAGVAHELNNPLAIILGNAELLPPMADEDDRRSIRQIIDAAHRSRRVLQSLVTFARHGDVEADWHSPRDLVERVLDLKRAAFQTGEIGLEIAYDPYLPMLWGDGPQIQQALLNVLLNAEQALVGREHARIVIQIYTCTAPVSPPSILPDLERASQSDTGERMIVFDIADNGPGLDGRVVDRLFEPYVTTRPIGQGAGMGLAITYAVVRQHGGSLQVASSRERGATFRIAMPVDRKPEKHETRRVPAPEAQPAGRILVIDDEPAIVDLVMRLLTRNGYTVVGMQRAREAIEELKKQPYDIVLCDMRMPDMDGIAFHHHVQDAGLAHPPRLVIMTGDTNNARTEAFLRKHKLLVLRKPFNRQELLAMFGDSMPSDGGIAAVSPAKTTPKIT